jgi:hypothetical protein
MGTRVEGPIIAPNGLFDCDALSEFFRVAAHPTLLCSPICSLERWSLCTRYQPSEKLIRSVSMLLGIGGDQMCRVGVR